MNVLDVLPVVAQLAATLAGFSALIALIDSNARPEWAEVAYNRVRGLLTLAFLAMFLSMLPFALLGAGIDEPLVWQLCLSAVLVSFAVNIPLQFKQIRKLTDASFNRPHFIFANTVSVAQITTVLVALFWPEILPRPGAYLIACLTCLLLASTLFFLLILQIIGGNIIKEEEDSK